jgi:hypothetical protein
MAEDVNALVKTWTEAGIPSLIPARRFRQDIAPMGSTFFYGEVSKRRLRVVQVAGKNHVPIEEAARYRIGLSAGVPA